MSNDSGITGLQTLLDECLSAGSAVRAWELFAERIHGLIAGAVVRTVRQFGVTPTRELVDDLVQDTYVKLCADNVAALRRFRGARPEALVAYLRAVAFNATRDHLRAAFADKRGAGQVVAPGDEVLAQVADARAEQASTERHILLEQIDRWLRAGSDPEMADRDRWVFWLYYRHGMTARAIAGIQAVGLSPKGVESVIHRLTRAVRTAFGDAAPAREGKGA